MNLGKDVGEEFNHIFIRDFDIDKISLIKLFIQLLLVSSVTTFWVTATIGEIPTTNIPYEMEILIFTIAGISMFFGGILTDYFSRNRLFDEILALVSIIPMVYILFLSEIFTNSIACIILGIISALLLIMLITNMLEDTSLLNRGRIVTYLFFGMGLFIGPLITIIVLFRNYPLVWIITGSLGVLSIYLEKKYPQEKMTGKKAYSSDLSFDSYWRILRETGAIPHFLFLFFTSSVLGFFTTAEFSESFTTNQIISLVVVGVISVPIIGAILDNIGRKPAGYMTLFILALFTIFFDYPDSNLFSIGEIRAGLFAFAALMIVVMTVVIAGDISKGSSRGRVAGFFLVATLLGIIAGAGIRIEFLNIERFNNSESLVQISDWATTMIIIVFAIFASTKDPFEDDSTDWRDFINSVYIISETGTSLYSATLRSKTKRKLPPKKKSPNEDLVSGGLTGLQALLKEISKSEKNIEVVDQGDIFLIFHYGLYTTAVLFSKRNLNVLKEKLGNFHRQFEFQNNKKLKNFKGEVSSLKGMDNLTKKYFR